MATASTRPRSPRRTTKRSSSAAPRRRPTGEEELLQQVAEAPAEKAPVAMPQQEPARSRAPKRRWVTMGVVGFVVLLVLASGTFALGVYQLGWQGAWVDATLRVLPLPAAVANNKLISYRDFRSDVDTLRYYYDHNQGVPGVPEEAPSDSDVRSTVLNRLVYDSIVEQLVLEHNIQVSDEELEQQLDGIAATQGSREDVGQLLQTLYGWNEAQFKEKVLLPYLWLQKLDVALNENGTLNGDVQQRAEEVLAKTQAEGASFENIAKEFSEDTSASVGGDLGFFGAGEMVKEFEDAVLALEPGQTSGLVKTQYGYHIIQLVEKVADGESGEQYHARHILIKTKPIDDYINEQLAAARVRVILPGYRWDADNHWVVPSNQEQAAS